MVNGPGLVKIRKQAYRAAMSYLKANHLGFLESYFDRKAAWDVDAEDRHRQVASMACCARLWRQGPATLAQPPDHLRPERPMKRRYLQSRGSDQVMVGLLASGSSC